MPIRSSVNSSEDNSSEALSEVGQERVPFFRRSEQSHQPLRSQKRIFRRLRLELVKAKRWPESGSRRSELRTNPARVSKDLRKSVAPTTR
jgi:hypothetical protein